MKFRQSVLKVSPDRALFVFIGVNFNYEMLPLLWIFLECLAVEYAAILFLATLDTVGSPCPPLLEEERSVPTSASVTQALAIDGSTLLPSIASSSSSSNVSVPFGDGYGIERMSSDSGILLGIILNFCHFLSDLMGLTK